MTFWPGLIGQTSQSGYAELNNDREDDTYGSSIIPDTKGTMTVTGAAEFYEGLTLPASFTVTNAAPTWILPATKTAPTLTGGTGIREAAIARGS